MIIKEIFKDGNAESSKNSMIEYSLDYLLVDDKINISYENKNSLSKFEEIQKIERIFSKFVYDLENNTILNKKELIEKWKEISTEMLLGKNKDFSSLSINLNRYYGNEENLDFILKEYSFMPFLIMLFDKKEKYTNKRFYNLLNILEIDFNIEKKEEIDRDKKKIEIEGKVAPSFKMYELKNPIKESIGISIHENMKLDIEMKGTAYYENEELKSGEIEVSLITDKDYSRIYRIEFIEEKS